MTITSEESFTSGGYRGMNYIMQYQGLKAGARVRVLVSGNRYYTLTAVAMPDVSNADALLLKALDSFTIGPPAVKNQRPV